VRLYTVHIRAGSREPDRQAVLVKEGFSWPAFFFTVIWALATRQWIVALVILGAAIVYQLVLAVLGFTGGLPTVAAAALFNLALGLFGNDLRRFTLSMGGWREAGVVAASGRMEAEQRWFGAQAA